MNCPKCNNKTSVNYTAASPDKRRTYRRRVCKTCGWVGYTTERLDEEGQHDLYSAKTERLHRRECQTNE